MNRRYSLMLSLPEELQGGPFSSVGGKPGPEPTEAELIERARGGDGAAFGQLYEIHYETILNYLYRRTLNLALAEDLTSNTFLKALRALPKYRHTTALRAWLYQIATNELRMHWRTQRRHHAAAQVDDWQAALDRVAFTEHETLARAEREERMQRYAALHQALQELPEKYQTALVLVYFEELSYEAVAQAMGKRLGTVKSLIYRGLKKLRKNIREHRAT